MRRIFISVPGDRRLTEAQIALKWALVRKFEEQGFLPEMFYSEHPHPNSLTAGRNWSFAECRNVLRRCVGAIIIGLPRHLFSAEDGAARLPTEYAQIEGALAISLEIPTFLLAEEGLSDRGMFFWGGTELITAFPQEVGADWLATDKFGHALAAFARRIAARRDIFLAYCSTSEGTARNIKFFIERETGASVLDWRTDFIEGRTIIEEIEEAARRTTGGIFLFTRDDALDGESDVAAPRDNVVFEAGFFAHAKSRERVLIIREKGAKMPADLGGNIYALLTDRTNIGPLEARLKRFIETAI